jgi:hypothetical protein
MQLSVQMILEPLQGIRLCHMTYQFEINSMKLWLARSIKELKLESGFLIRPMEEILSR